MYSKTLNPIFFISTLFLFLFLYIRITRGIDLTDEMQYYGEIKGLIESNKLFSNDLFFQQNIYILFYPIFLIYNKLYSYEAFVFFGRLVMASLSLCTYIFVYYKLISRGCLNIVSLLIALVLALLSCYTGIFAISYNSMSGLFWIIFIIIFFEWKVKSVAYLALISTLTIYAHPTSAIAMILLSITRIFFEKDIKTLISYSLFLFIFGLILLSSFLYFGSLSDYLNSLKFSAGYAIGSLFKSHYQILKLVVLLSLFGLCFLFKNKLQSTPILSFFIISLLVAFIAMLIKFDSIQNRLFYIFAVLCLLAYARALVISKRNETDCSKINWMLVGILLCAVINGGTSGNGIVNSFIGFAIGLPLLIGFTLNSKNQNSLNSYNKETIIVSALSLLNVAIFIYNNNYREVSWGEASNKIVNVSEFKFIKTSLERSKFIENVHSNIGPIVKDKKTLIIGHFPGLYFASGANIETCMLYMHSITSDSSEDVLINCLINKRPKIIINIFSDDEIIELPRIKFVLNNFYNLNDSKCTIQKELLDASSFPPFKWRNYQICML